MSQPGSTITEVFARTKTITFDCYGTLIDWKGGLTRSFWELFGPLADERRDELFDLYVQVEAEVEGELYRRYREVLVEVVLRMSRHLDVALPGPRAGALAEMLPTWAPFPDTNDALVRLKRRFRLGVLSNIDRVLFTATSQQFSVPFDFVVTAEDVQAYKPSQAHFRRMLEQHGDKKTVLHVAQSLFHDGKPCGELGIPFAWINRYGQENDTTIQPLADFADLKSFSQDIVPD